MTLALITHRLVAVGLATYFGCGCVYFRRLARRWDR